MKFDAQHILLIAFTILTAMEPSVADLVSPGWQPKVASLVAGILAAITGVLALFKTSPQDLKAKLGSKSLGAVGAVVGCFLFLLACTQQQAKTAAVDLTNAACTQLEAQPEPAWVAFSCEIVQAGETLLFTAKVPATQAKTYALSHAKR
jgi:hypothetical protein